MNDARRSGCTEVNLRLRDSVVASDMDESSQLDSDSSKPPRWKLLLWLEAILVLIWAVLKKVPSFEEMGAGGAIDLLFVIFVLLMALIWLLFLSRLRWRVRLVGVAIMLALVSVVKMDGHTGNFFPQFSWRWTKQPASEIPN